MKKTVLTLTLAALVSMLSLVPALAADWPSKPVTVIVPWAAGGMTDITTRLLVERFKDKLGQPVVVSNQGGALKSGSQVTVVVGGSEATNLTIQ